MIRLAAVVILYHPDDKLAERINTYVNNCEALFIIDNSPVPTIIDLKDPKIEFFHDGLNKGIAKCLNLAAKLAIERGFEFLLCFDQDSFFGENALTGYMHCLETFPGLGTTALFGVQFTDPDASHQHCDPTEVTDLITSGSILNLRLFPIIGPFDENLFIDLVDYEYCFRSKMKGYQVVRFRNVFLHHELGKQTMHRSLITFKKTPRSLHTPVRIYYLTRNYFYLKEIYGAGFPQQLDHIRKDLVYRLKNNLLYSKKRLAVIRYFLKGMRDYKKNKLGAIQ